MMFLKGIPSLENAPSLENVVHFLMSLRAAGESISFFYDEIENLRRFAPEHSKETSICHAERSEASRFAT